MPIAYRSNETERTTRSTSSNDGPGDEAPTSNRPSKMADSKDNTQYGLTVAYTKDVNGMSIFFVSYSQRVVQDYQGKPSMLRRRRQDGEHTAAKQNGSGDDINMLMTTQRRANTVGRQCVNQHGVANVDWVVCATCVDICVLVSCQARGARAAMPCVAVGASVNEPKTHEWCRPCRLGWGQRDESTIRGTACFWEDRCGTQGRSGQRPTQFRGGQGRDGAEDGGSVEHAACHYLRPPGEKTQGTGKGGGVQREGDGHPGHSKGPGRKQWTGGNGRGRTKEHRGTHWGARMVAILAMATTAYCSEQAWTGEKGWNTEKWGGKRMAQYPVTRAWQHSYTMHKDNTTRQKGGTSQEESTNDIEMDRTHRATWDKRRHHDTNTTVRTTRGQHADDRTTEDCREEVKHTQSDGDARRWRREDRRLGATRNNGDKRLPTQGVRKPHRGEKEYHRRDGDDGLPKTGTRGRTDTMGGHSTNKRRGTEAKVRGKEGEENKMRWRLQCVCCCHHAWSRGKRAGHRRHPRGRKRERMGKEGWRAANGEGYRTLRGPDASIWGPRDGKQRWPESVRRRTTTMDGTNDTALATTRIRGARGWCTNAVCHDLLWEPDPSAVGMGTHAWDQSGPDPSTPVCRTAGTVKPTCMDTPGPGNPARPTDSMEPRRPSRSTAPTYATAPAAVSDATTQPAASAAAVAAAAPAPAATAAATATTAAATTAAATATAPTTPATTATTAMLQPPTSAGAGARLGEWEQADRMARRRNRRAGTPGVSGLEATARKGNAGSPGSGGCPPIPGRRGKMGGNRSKKGKSTVMATRDGDEDHSDRRIQAARTQSELRKGESRLGRSPGKADSGGDGGMHQGPGRRRTPDPSDMLGGRMCASGIQMGMCGSTGCRRPKTNAADHGEDGVHPDDAGRLRHPGRMLKGMVKKPGKEMVRRSRDEHEDTVRETGRVCRGCRETDRQVVRNAHKTWSAGGGDPGPDDGVGRGTKGKAGTRRANGSDQGRGRRRRQSGTDRVQQPGKRRSGGNDAVGPTRGHVPRRGTRPTRRRRCEHGGMPHKTHDQRRDRGGMDRTSQRTSRELPSGRNGMGKGKRQRTRPARTMARTDRRRDATSTRTAGGGTRRTDARPRRDATTPRNRAAEEPGGNHGANQQTPVRDPATSDRTGGGKESHLEGACTDPTHKTAQGRLCVERPKEMTEPGIWVQILGGGRGESTKEYSAQRLLTNAEAEQGANQYKQWREWRRHRQPHRGRTTGAPEGAATGPDREGRGDPTSGPPRRLQQQPRPRPRQGSITPQQTTRRDDAPTGYHDEWQVRRTLSTNTNMQTRSRPWMHNTERPQATRHGDAPTSEPSDRGEHRAPTGANRRVERNKGHRCRPDCWKWTLVHRMPELWNDPGARQALQRITTKVPPQHEQEWNRNKLPPCKTTSTNNPPGGRAYTQRCRCRKRDRAIREAAQGPEEDRVWETLLRARDSLMCSERAGWNSAQDEAWDANQWERWAAQRHGELATRMKAPPRRGQQRGQTGREDRQIIRDSMQILNALRARNSFRWLMTQMAQGKHRNSGSVAGIHWERVHWTACILQCATDGEETSQYIPREVQGVLRGTQVCRPTWGDCGSGKTLYRNTAWVYAMSSVRSRRVYVGATDRKQPRNVDGTMKPLGCQSPGLRHAEHICRGWWIARGHHRPDSQDKMPMYTMAQRWAYGLSELVMTPVVAITRNGTGNEGERGNGTAKVALRSQMLALEAALQRKWRPTLVSPWAETHRRTRTHDLPAPAVEAVGDGGDDTIPSLVYARTRARWNPRTDWRAQYGAGVLVLSNEGTPWSTRLCDAVVTRLLHHGKQAVSMYKVIRRAGKPNLARLWTWAAQGGRAREARVWAHIEKALHGRTDGIRQARVCVRDYDNGKTSTSQHFRRAWTVAAPILGPVQDMYMTRRVHHPNVAEIIRTDISCMAWETVPVCEMRV